MHIYRSQKEIDRMYDHLRKLREFPTKEALIEYCSKVGGPLWIVRYSAREYFRVQGPLEVSGVESLHVDGHDIPILKIKPDKARADDNASTRIYEVQLPAFYAVFSKWNDAYHFLGEVQIIHQEDEALREYLIKESRKARKTFGR
jgi:hypothetical protein